jgi:hypothetical protein
MNIITSGTSEAVLLAGSPPSLDAIAAAAESACRRSYAGFDDPTEDVTPHAMLSVPGGVLALPLPTNDDPLRKALLACRWLPTLIWRTRATACLLVQPAWCMFGSDGWRPGTAICDHPQRKEVVMFAGQDMSGAALRRSRSVARHADGSSSFGETALTPHKAADAGLFVRALTAAFGTFAADEAQRVFRLRWAHDMRARKRSLPWTRCPRNFRSARPGAERNRRQPSFLREAAMCRPSVRYSDSPARKTRSCRANSLRSSQTRRSSPR